MEEMAIIKEIHETCIDCGKEFIITPAEQNFYKKRGFGFPKRCPECREEKKKVKKVVCMDCGRPFEINGVEISYYKRNGLEIPKRCPKCRKFKREKNDYFKKKQEQELGIQDE